MILVEAVPERTANMQMSKAVMKEQVGKAENFCDLVLRLSLRAACTKGVLSEFSISHRDRCSGCCYKNVVPVLAIFRV